MVQFYTSKKNQLALQVNDAKSYEAVPKLVKLTGPKMVGNILLVICHSYNAAVTKAYFKTALVNIKSASSIQTGTSSGSSNANQLIAA